MRFERCIAYAQGLAGTEEEPAYGRRRSAYFNNDDSDDSDDSDSDSSDDERDRRRRKSKDRKHRKSLRKRKERRNEKASEKLSDLHKLREEEARRKKEEAWKKAEEARKKDEEACRKEEEIRQKEDDVRKEKEEVLKQQEATRRQMEEIQRQLEEMRILKIQGRLGYGHANLMESGQVGSGPVNANLIEAGRPDWMAGNPDIVCYSCETPGHYESRCWKPRVSPEIRAEIIQRINGNRPYNPPAGNGRRGQYPPRYERRSYVPPELYLEEPPRENPTQMQREVEELRLQIRDLQRVRQPPQAEGSGTAPGSSARLEQPWGSLPTCCP